jgi:prepilin-type N-terminal cleavage/methylation domain-containing protein
MQKTKGMGMIEILISLIIIAILMYTILKMVNKDVANISPQERKALAEQGIKTNSPRGVIQSARDTVNQVNKKNEDYQKQFEGK